MALEGGLIFVDADIDDGSVVDGLFRAGLDGLVPMRPRIRWASIRQSLLR